MFFDFFYTHRTIWMDGRKLEEDPEPTWYGYAVGHWDGNTLVVDSNGFNGRGWFANGGYPWSEDAKLEERYTRANHDTINVTMTLTDPATYTKPWVIGPATLKWTPKEVMREDVCAPSDEKKYLDEIREPAGRKPGQQSSSILEPHHRLRDGDGPCLPCWGYYRERSTCRRRIQERASPERDSRGPIYGHDGILFRISGVELHKLSWRRQCQRCRPVRGRSPTEKDRPPDGPHGESHQ
jgi:hypothetical protein